MSARDIILRRRAALVTSALTSALCGLTVAAPVRASEPDEATVAEARALADKGLSDEALAKLFGVDAPSTANLLLRGRLLRSLERFAAARTALTLALPRVTDADRKLLVEQQLTDLAQRTVELRIRTSPTRSTHILIDGEDVGEVPLPGRLFVLPGQHVIEVRSDGFDPKTETIDAAGGSNIELDMHLLEPMPCLSPPPPPPFEEVHGGAHWGIGAAYEAHMNVARDQGVPLMGASLSPFIEVGMGPFAAHVGAFGSVHGSERGLAGTGGMRFEARLALLDFVAWSVGASAGYLHLPDAPEPAELDGLSGLRTVSSYFVRPETGVTIMVGPVQAGPRIGVLMSRGEEGLRGEFGPSYVSVGMWVSYVHLPDPYAADD